MKRLLFIWFPIFALQVEVGLAFDKSIFLDAKDGEYTVRTPLAIHNVKTTTLGSLPEIPEVNGYGINTVRVSHEGERVELTFVDGDALGCVFRHVPRLPDMSQLVGCKTLDGVALKLGRPHSSWEWKGMWEWNFFSIGNEKLMVMSILFLKGENHAGIRIVEGWSKDYILLGPLTGSKTNGKASPSGIGESSNNSRSAPRLVPEGPPPAKPGSAPR